MILSINKGPAFDSSVLYNEVKYDKHFFSPVKWVAHLYVLKRQKTRYIRVLKDELMNNRFCVLHNVRTLRNFSTAAYFLFQLRKIPIDQLHAHFLSLPATIGMLMSKISGVDLSCSAHANDIFTTKKEELVIKMRHVKFIVSCTGYNVDYLKKMSTAVTKTVIHHIYHGIDLAKWPRKKVNFNRITDHEIHILSIGRLVEKKGLIYLLEAVYILKSKGHIVKCSIVGDGPLHQSFLSYIRDHQLEKTVYFLGALPQKEIRPFYEKADLFVLPCIEAANGDKDGLPNVLIEALAVGLPVVTTPVSAIPELIEHEVTGLLVPEKDSDCLANAILRLKKDTTLYHSLVKMGWEKVKDFNIEKSTNQLCKLFEEPAPLL